MSEPMPAQLPPNWTEVKLHEVVQTSSGGTPSSKNPAFYGGRIPWVKIGDLTDGPVRTTEQTITEEGLAASSAKWLPAGTVLVAMYGSIGKLGVLEMPAATNQAICAMQPTEAVHARLLFWFLRSQRSRLLSIGRGGTQQNIGQADLKALRMALPPRMEQDRIVRELELRRGQVDDGARSIAEAQAGIQRYRRAVLQDGLANCVGPAVEGGHQQGLPDLPRGWRWSTVGAVGNVQLGRMLNKERSSGPSMRPYLRVANVLDDQLDLTDVKEMDFPPEEYERYLLHPGDILLNEGQSPELLGRAAMYRGERPGLCFQKTLLRFQAGELVEPEFALLVFRYYLYAGRFRREVRITTGIGHLTGVRFAAMEFPVPPMDEQRRIVTEVRAQLDAADRLEDVLGKTLRDAVALHTSLLTAAVSGGLSDPAGDDEPAEALVRRILENHNSQKKGVSRTSRRRVPVAS